MRRGDRDAASVIGTLAASLDLVPAGTRLSARELLDSLLTESPWLPPPLRPEAPARCHTEV